MPSAGMVRWPDDPDAPIDTCLNRGPPIEDSAIGRLVWRSKLPGGRERAVDTGFLNEGGFTRL